MARVIRRIAPLVGVLALLVIPSAAQSKGPSRLLYEWQPNGEGTGPRLELEDKTEVTGRFGLKCGRDWIYAIFGGGAFVLDEASETLSGTAHFPAGSVGRGSSYRSSEVDFFDFKSAGPVVMSLNAHANFMAAIGTIAMKVYAFTKPHGHGAHRTKRREVLSDSCSIPFDAPNHYYEVPAAPESPPGE